MREIKFRAWDKRTNQMKPVANISFGYDGSALTIIADLAPKGQNWNAIDGAIVHGESGILMQYTGLTDSKGTEIYDGDIVHITWAFEEYNARVFWGRTRPINSWDSGEAWMLHFNGLPDEREGPLLPYCEGNRGGHEIRVIGNIYEHPRLLEPKP